MFLKIFPIYFKAYIVLVALSFLGYISKYLVCTPGGFDFADLFSGSLHYTIGLLCPAIIIAIITRWLYKKDTIFIRILFYLFWLLSIVLITFIIISVIQFHYNENGYCYHYCSHGSFCSFTDTNF
jgi:hypothetical protein